MLITPPPPTDHRPRFTGDWICHAANARWAHRLPHRLPHPGASVEVSAIATDSRIDLRGKAFLALKGQQFDGHRFLVGAASAGAALFIIELHAAKDALPLGVSTLIVEDTRKALASLGAAHRRRLDSLSVIAVTGSSGKTTTKRLIDAALSPTRCGRASDKSFNNDIGVPLTLLSAEPGDDYLVVEIGMNHPGEIAPLSAMAEPDIAVITMIGRAHLGGMKSIDAIAREKASILNHLRAGGLGIIPAACPVLDPYLPNSIRLLRFGEGPNADIRLADRRTTPAGQHLRLADGAEFTLPLPGRHNAHNALAAIAVAREFGLDDTTIAANLNRATSAPMRFQPERHGEIVVVNDAYNANPESMRAAIETFSELYAQSPSRVIILGDMFELGDESEALHAEVGRTIRAAHEHAPLRRIILIGRYAKATAATLRQTVPSSIVSIHPPLTDELAREIASLLHPGDVVLLKASRSAALERILKHLPEPAPVSP